MPPSAAGCRRKQQQAPAESASLMKHFFSKVVDAATQVLQLHQQKELNASEAVQPQFLEAIASPQPDRINKIQDLLALMRCNLISSGSEMMEFFVKRVAEMAGLIPEGVSAYPTNQPCKQISTSPAIHRHPKQRWHTTPPAPRGPSRTAHPALESPPNPVASTDKGKAKVGDPRDVSLSRHAMPTWELVNTVTSDCQPCPQFDFSQGPLHFYDYTPNFFLDEPQGANCKADREAGLTDGPLFDATPDDPCLQSQYRAMLLGNIPLYDTDNSSGSGGTTVLSLDQIDPLGIVPLSRTNNPGNLYFQIFEIAVSPFDLGLQQPTEDPSVTEIFHDSVCCSFGDDLNR